MRSATVTFLTALLLAAGATAETTRTIRAEIQATDAFAVENLSGHMTVVPGDGDTVVAVAAVHAETAALADAVRIDSVKGENGVATLRVIYPVSEHRTFRSHSSGSSQVKYDGHTVKVSSTSGVLLWADVEVRVPRRQVVATFRNLVGELDADGVEGVLLLDAASGRITARRLSGKVTADTGSGEVLAEDVRGVLLCDTGSGRIGVDRFEGSELACDTGSGSIAVSGVKAGSVKTDTGSGAIHVRGAEIESFAGDTGSGDIVLEVAGTTLRRVHADTGSGSVTLRLPAETGFVLRSDQGSGDLECGFEDARAVVKGREVVGYRRGDERVSIEVDTGSGDVRVAPR